MTVLYRHPQLRFLPLLAISIVQISCSQTSSAPTADAAVAPTPTSTLQATTISTNEATKASSSPQTTPSASETAPAPQPPKVILASNDDMDFHGLVLGDAVHLTQEYSDDDTGVTGITETVQFSPGTSSKMLSNAVVRGTVNKYYLTANGGQVMDVKLFSTQNQGVFQVYLKYEGTWRPFYGAEPGADTTKWLSALPGNTALDLLVVVGATAGNTTYDLFIGVE